MITRSFTHELRRSTVSAPREQRTAASVWASSPRLCLLALPMAALIACRVAVAAPAEETTMTTSTTTETVATSGAAQGESIRPFKFQATQEQLDDLRRRITVTKWPDKETV